MHIISLLTKKNILICSLIPNGVHPYRSNLPHNENQVETVCIKIFDLRSILSECVKFYRNLNLKNFKQEYARSVIASHSKTKNKTDWQHL